MVWRDPVPGHRIFVWGRFLGLDLELAPEGGDVGLLVIHLGEFHHVVANSGVSPVASKHEVEADLNFAPVPRISARPIFADFKPCLVLLEVCSCELVVKEEFHIGHSLKDIEKPLIEAAAINCQDGL